MGRPSIPKLFAKITPKVARFEPPSTGGTKGITPEDMSTVLGLVPRQAALLIRAKWTMDLAAARVLVGYMVEKSERRMRHRRWRARSGRTVARMVWVVLMEMEVVRPSRVEPDGYEIGAAKCGGCGGVGRRYSRKQAKHIQCDRCGGSGERLMSDRERAGRCGLRHQSWSENWEDLYRWMQADLKNAYTLGMRSIARRLRDDE